MSHAVGVPSPNNWTAGEAPSPLPSLEPWVLFTLLKAIHIFTAGGRGGGGCGVKAEPGPGIGAAWHAVAAAFWVFWRIVGQWRQRWLTHSAE